ncbi:hypothetical protein BASA81_016116 [Batrachochytrium salamandrivorans]|nr:hypothetical protein BASA81_016116 [Batrachochytrium salamandrivorans]
MQFFYLFSFVVVASYTAALPQPAGLSEKYSSNVDTNLASGLEARSYQPGSNSQKNSATLMSLKRRDDSEGSSGENSGSDPSPPSATTFKPRIGDGFTKEEILTINIASTIDRAINGDYTMLYMQEDAGNKIGGRIGNMVAEYIGISTHVIGVLRRWDQDSMYGIRDFIKSGLGDEKYSEVEPDLTEKLKDFEYVSNDEAKAINITTEDIIDSRGTVAENLQKINESFKLIVNSQVLLLLKLKDLLGRFDDVPGLPRDTNPIRGLMYADDVAVFADSEQSLLAASTAIEQWANQWEMQFGVAKCGIISFTGHLAPRLDNPLDIRLHGQLVSRVESYKYLGVLIHSKLDHSAWLKQKRSALEHTISALHPVLANHQLTVNYRSRIFSAVVMGKAYYGLELIGGNKSHLAPLQTTINKGIRLFTGARLSTAIGPLLVETGIGSLLTRSLVSRVRLLERSVTKRTPINAICSGTDNDVFTLNVQGQLVRSQRWFWSRRTKQLYRNRYWLTPQVRPKTVKQRHSFALMETLRTCGDSASLQKYVTRQLLDTAGFFKDPSFDQSRAHGTRYLMLARMDALWTARKAIQIGILVDTHPFSVDHCILCDQQLLSTSIAHLVVECEQVTGHRIQSGLVPAIQKSRLRLLGRALDPGVENVYTWLRGGVLNGEADLDQRWLDGTVEHESMGTRHDNRALAARLADFLQVAYRQYQSTLWKYHRDRLVEVG